MTATADPTFYLGLTMAGAISAGAYTGGVLDVLLEALDKHNARFEAGKATGWTGPTADNPRHRVVLRVISGTSAGGVSAGLAVAGLIGARLATDGPNGEQIGTGGSGNHTAPGGYVYTYDYILKPLHHVWVEALDLWRDEGGRGPEGFLTLGDLKDTDLGDGQTMPRPLASLLNSDHIDKAASDALQNITWSGSPYRFLSQDLDLFLTTTNLQGVPYEVRFSGSSGDDGAGHTMAQHSTVRHFRVPGLGTIPKGSSWLEAWDDQGITLTLPASADAQIDFEDRNETWRGFRDASIATGAFPVGLASRVIEAEARDLGLSEGREASTGGAWPIDVNPKLCGDDDTVLDIRPRPRLGSGTEPNTPTPYVAVDGGVANNEPFELARFTLREPMVEGACTLPGEKFLAPNPRNAHDADRAVLMIDPFPEGPVFSPMSLEQAQALRGIIPAISKLLPALINQARFKPGELIEASSDKVHSRYLIAPSRRLSTGETSEDVRLNESGSNAIASGSFGGFGGFFARAFRAHDYMLGQRNCQSFLNKYFTLHGSNPVLGLKGTGREADEDVRVIDPGPEFFSAKRALPAWPRIDQPALAPILKAARTRVGEVGVKLLSSFNLDIPGLMLKFAWSIDFLGARGIGPKVSSALSVMVLSELIARDQYHPFRDLDRDPRDGGEFAASDQRRVLVELAKAGEVPIAVAASAADYAQAQKTGQPPRDLLHLIWHWKDAETEDSRNNTLGNLNRFIQRIDDERLLWRAPDRGDGIARYTLALQKPGMIWWKKIQGFGARIRGWLG